MEDDNNCNFTPAICDDVQIHLDTLNYTASKTNELENKLREAKNDFETTLAERKVHLQLIENRLGKCVHRARPYYEACDRRPAILLQIQQAAEVFDKSCAKLSAYRKEFLAVQSASSSTDYGKLDLVNELVYKINVTEKEVLDATSLHENLMAYFQDMENKISRMKKDNMKSILKAQPYFDALIHFDQNLNECKERIQACSDSAKLSKALYAKSLAELDNLSMSLHAKRARATQSSETRNQSRSASPSSVGDPLVEGPPTPTLLTLVRGRGVGAESSDLPEDNATVNGSHGYRCGTRSVDNLLTRLPALQCNNARFNEKPVDSERSRLCATLSISHSSPAGLVDDLPLNPSSQTYHHGRHLSSSERTRSISTNTSSSLQSTTVSWSSSIDYTLPHASELVDPLQPSYSPSSPPLPGNQVARGRSMPPAPAPVQQSTADSRLHSSPSQLAIAM